MNNLAISYPLGRYAEAAKLHEEVLTLTKSLGPDHPETLMSMDNLATSYGGSAGTPRPSSSVKRCCRMRKSSWAPTTLIRSRAWRTWPSSYDGLGRHAEALTLYEEVLR